MKFISLSSALIVALVLVGCSTLEIKTSSKAHLSFLGEYVIPTGAMYKDTQIGGLSGIFWQKKQNRLLAISDDRSQFQPARMYEFKVDLSNRKLQIEPTKVTYLRDKQNKFFPESLIDPEGITILGNTIFIATESIIFKKGSKFKNVNGTILALNHAGKEKYRIEIPRKYQIYAKKNKNDKIIKKGIRDNKGFESLTLTPSHRYIATATESALEQDDTIANLQKGSRTRILIFKKEGKIFRPSTEFVYPIDTVKPLSANYRAIQLAENGLVELLAVSDSEFYALERMYNNIEGKGFVTKILLYKFNLNNETNVIELDQLRNQYYIPIQKKLVFDFDDIVDQLTGKTLDNIEGMTFGPKLANGKRTLLFVSDNNFNHKQRTLFLAFALNE